MSEQKEPYDAEKGAYLPHDGTLQYFTNEALFEELAYRFSAVLVCTLDDGDNEQQPHGKEHLSTYYSGGKYRAIGMAQSVICVLLDVIRKAAE